MGDIDEDSWPPLGLDATETIEWCQVNGRGDLFTDVAFWDAKSNWNYGLPLGSIDSPLFTYSDARYKYIELEGVMIDREAITNLQDLRQRYPLLAEIALSQGTRGFEQGVLDMEQPLVTEGLAEAIREADWNPTDVFFRTLERGEYNKARKVAQLFYLNGEPAILEQQMMEARRTGNKPFYVFLKNLLSN